MARAGVMPAPDAALMSAVVLNGAGGLSWRGSALYAVTSAVSTRARSRAVSMASCVSKPPAGVRHLERLAVVLERRLELPVRHGHERAALELAVDHQAQRRRLDAPHREVVRAVAVRGERHEAREHRAPDEVDVLPRVRRLGEVEVDGGGLGERGRDLLRRERRVAHADVPVHHGRRQHGLDVRVAVGRLGRRRGLGARLGAVLGRGLALLLLRLVAGIVLEGVAAQDLERLVADELALAVVVGGDDELGGALGDRAQRGERARGAAVHDPGEVRTLDHLAQVLETPAPVGVGEHGLHDVTAQPDGHGVVAVEGEVVGPHLGAAAAVLLDGRPCRRGSPRSCAPPSPSL